MMKKNLFFITLVAAMTALLLLGCKEGSPLAQKVQEEQTEAKNDSLKKDSMQDFYERMERWEMLHGG